MSMESLFEEQARLERATKLHYNSTCAAKMPFEMMDISR